MAPGAHLLEPCVFKITAADLKVIELAQTFRNSASYVLILEQPLAELPVVGQPGWIGSVNGLLPTCTKPRSRSASRERTDANGRDWTTTDST